MTEATNDGIFTLSKPVILAFPHLFEAKPFMKNGKEAGEAKFSGNFTFDNDSDELKALKVLAGKLAKAKWPDVEFKNIKFPFTSGDKLAEKRAEKGKTDGEWQRGKVVVVARSKYEPRLSYIENGRLIDLDNDAAKEAAKGKFYPGVEVLAQFNLVPNEAGDNKYITAYLNMVCSTGKGTRISGGATASETFKGYVGSVSTEDPTAPGSDESLDDLMG